MASHAGLAPTGVVESQPTARGRTKGGSLAGHEQVVVKVEVAGRWAHWHASCLECSWTGPDRDSHAEALVDAESHAYGNTGVPQPQPI